MGTMIGDASISFVGNVSQDPELRFTPAGQPVCNLSVAVQGRRKSTNGDGYEDGPVSFYRLTCWRDLAEHVAESVSKGDRVIVTGDLAIRSYDRPDGTKGTSVEVEVSEIGPSLRFATARPVKVARKLATV